MPPVHPWVTDDQHLHLHLHRPNPNPCIRIPSIAQKLHPIYIMDSMRQNTRILIIPDHLHPPYTMLPKTFIGDFLGLHGIDVHCTKPTSIPVPLRMNDVKCVLQLTVKIVSSAFFVR